MIFTIFVGTIVLVIVDRLYFRKIHLIINYLKYSIIRNSTRILMEMAEDNSPCDLNGQDESNLKIEETGGRKLFEFIRVRCKNLKTDNKLLSPDPTMNYEVPTKRSGHRAACDDENLWIWGGYCPIEVTAPISSIGPMLPDVTFFTFLLNFWRS